MAGFLGAKFKTPDPNGYGWADKLNLLGAAFRDAGDPDAHGANAANVQQILMARQQQARLAQANAALTGLFGGSAPQAAPDMSAPTPIVSPAMSFPSQGTGSPALNLPQINAPPPRPPAPKLPSISDPAVLQKLLQIKAAGGDIGPAVEFLKANKAPDPRWAYDTAGNPYNASSDQAPPHASNFQRMGSEIRDTNAPGLDHSPVIETDKGQYVVWKDGVPHYENVQGAPEAIGRVAGAVAGAQEAAKAAQDIVSVDVGGGRKMQMTRADAARRLGGAGGGAPGGSPAVGADLGGSLGLSSGTADTAYSEAGGKQVADLMASAPDLRSKAVANSQSATNGLHLALSLDPNAALPLKQAATEVLRTLPWINKDRLNSFAGDAKSYQMITTELLVQNAKALGANPSNRDAKIMEAVFPGLTTPKSASAPFFATQAATANKQQAYADFLANYNGPHDPQQVQKAWINSPEGKRSIFQDPIWQSFTIGGQPMVKTVKYKDGKTYGIVRPGSPQAQVFEWGQ